MMRSRYVRRFLRGRRAIVKSYQACWYARGLFQEKLCVRVDRYWDRCTIVGQIFAMSEAGEGQPAHTQRRRLTLPEWDQVSAWLDAGFWPEPAWDAATPVMDGECWQIAGDRHGDYHEVYRRTGSLLDGTGARVFELGRQLARLAGIRRFD